MPRARQCDQRKRLPSASMRFTSGENLFIAAYRFDKPIHELARAVQPMVLILFVGVMAITYVPALSLWLLRITGH